MRDDITAEERAIFTREGAAKSVTYSTTDGQEVAVAGDHVVNTTPPPRMLEAMDPPLGDEVAQAMSNLSYLGIVFLHLEISTPLVSPDHWIYLPETSLTIHRISKFKNFSDHEAPGDKTMICCEVAADQETFG